MVTRGLDGASVSPSLRGLPSLDSPGFDLQGRKEGTEGRKKGKKGEKGEGKNKMEGRERARKGKGREGRLINLVRSVGKCGG